MTPVLAGVASPNNSFVLLTIHCERYEARYDLDPLSRSRPSREESSASYRTVKFASQVALLSCSRQPLQSRHERANTVGFATRIDMTEILPIARELSVKRLAAVTGLSELPVLVCSSGEASIAPEVLGNTSWLAVGSAEWRGVGYRSPRWRTSLATGGRACQGEVIGASLREACLLRSLES